MERTESTKETVLVRGLRPDDLEAVIAVDAKNVGRRRDEYFKVKLRQNLAETGIKISLAAEMDRCFCGFLLARVFYGEFGTMEPVAVLETLGVPPGFRNRGVGSALLLQLRKNLAALRVLRLQTEVDWEDQELLAFFHREGFRPAPRFCLDLDVSRPRPRSDGP